MINSNLHKQPVALDRERHRDLKLDHRAADLSTMAGINSYFINAAEFGDACLEYPIVFVLAGGPEGQRVPAPVAVFGLEPGENLFVDGNRWDAAYVPAHLRIHPFAIVRADEHNFVLVVDESSAALSRERGEALFDAEGALTPYMHDVQRLLHGMEQDLENTRLFCQRLQELELLQSMRFDVTQPDGKTLTVDGFMAVDEKKLETLPDAAVVELHRNGALGLLLAHQLSMRNMRRLVERRARRGIGVAEAPAQG